MVCAGTRELDARDPVNRETPFHAGSIAKSLTSYGLCISGKAAKSAPVKISVKYGSKKFSITVKSFYSGNFSYKFTKTTKTTCYVPR